MAAAGNFVVFEATDEKKVKVRGGKEEVRCVEFHVAAAGGRGGGSSGPVLLLTVTEGKEVAEVVDEEVVIAGSGGCYYEERTGTWEHLVDVQTDYEAFLLQVSVREDEGRIVRICRFN